MDTAYVVVNNVNIYIFSMPAYTPLQYKLKLIDTLLTSRKNVKIIH